METYSPEKILDVSPSAILVTDGKGVIVQHNETAVQLLGGPLNGKTFSSFHRAGKKLEVLRRSNAIALALDPGGQLGFLQGKNDELLITSITTKALGDGSEAIYIRNISEQVQYILAVKEQQQTEQELYRSSHIRLGKFEEALREIALRSAETMKVKRVNIWEIGDGFNSIRSIVNYDARNGGFLENIVLYRHQFPTYFSLMQTEEIIPTTDAQHDPKIAEIRDSYIIPSGIRALLDTPVRIEGKMAGVICFEDTDQTREWNLAELNFSVAIAQVVAQTLESHRRQVAQKELEQALSEKKLLLAEVNHRIKNNFSLVGDLVRLQEEKAKDDYHHALFAEIRNRIQSMAMIHRQLYVSENIGAVNFREFLIDLAAHFRSTFATEGIEISTMLDNCRLKIGKAVLCGLVVNELLTNSCRHAFSDHKGHIRLQLQTLGGTIQVTVSDNGAATQGMPDGLGTELVYELIDRLGGSIEQKTGNGLSTRISFSAS